MIVGMTAWIFLMRILAGTGSEAVAGATITIRIMMFTLMPAWGMSNAAATLVGQNLGASRPDRAEASVWRIGWYNMAFMVCVSLALFLFHHRLIGLFTDDAGIHAIGTQYFRIIGPSYPFVGVSMVVAFAFQGLGRATVPLAWSVVRIVAVLAVAVACTHGLGLGERAVFTTIALGNVASAAALTALFVRTERRLRQASASCGRAA